MRNYSQIKKELLKDKDIRRTYDALGPDFDLARLVISKRLERGMTQKDLAAKIGTRQSAISRLESGLYNPSLAFLGRIARALDARLDISIH